MLKLAEIVEKYSIYLTAFLVPIAILPIFSDAFTTIKVIILVTGVAIALLAKTAKMLITGKLNLRVSNFDFPLFLIAIAYLVSTILRTPNKMEAFFLPGTATIIISSFLLYFLTNQLEEKDRKNIPVFIVISGVLASILTLFATTGILKSIPHIPAFFSNKAFTTMGGNLPSAIFLGTIIPLIIGFLVFEKTLVKKVFWAISGVIITLGLLTNIYNILPGKPASPKFPDYKTFWNISIDTLKNSPVLGIGPGNYLTAFNKFRPITYNQTDLWTVKFSTARSFALSLITETGFLGLAGLILLAIVIYRKYQNEVKENKFLNFENENTTNFISLIVLFILSLILLLTPSTILLFFILFAINSKTKEIVLNLSAQGIESQEKQNGQWLASRIPAILVALPVLIALVALSYFSVNAVRAEATIKKSIDALNKNDGNKTYELMRKAISQNGYVDRYHILFSQINLALANSITQNPKGEKEQLSDDQRNSVTQLIQQSIAEAKAAVTLNPTRSENWTLLADTYRSVMAFAKGSDQFAIQSYNQAIALDPINTNLRLSLGGVYYALGDYDSAIDTLKLAVLTKPDHANARYNLATAYKDKGEIDKAINEMTIVLSLLDKNSQDYKLAKKELDNLEAKKPTKTKETAKGENLIPPQQQGEPVVQPPIELPNEAQPPEPQVTPTPEPNPTPAEEPTASPTPTPIP